MLIVTHNADCEAYEAKIAELESRLAHIGAEVANLREQVNGLCEIDMNAMAALSEVVGLRQELKQARAESNSATCAKQEHAVTIEGLIEKIEGLESELLKVRAERQTRPVKARFNPSILGDDGYIVVYGSDDVRHNLDAGALECIFRHSVIEVPADVPSAEDIWDAYLKSGKANEVALVNWILPHLAPWLQPRTVMAEQIEKAARGLYENYVIWSWGRAGDWTKESDVCRNLWKDRAIAAFAAAGFTVEGRGNG
jgi:ribosomal protein L29